MSSTFKAADIDRAFDDGGDVMDFFDTSNPIVEDAPAVDTRRVTLTLPAWMIEQLDDRARSLAVSRNAVVNMWLDERLKTERESAMMVGA